MNLSLLDQPAQDIDQKALNELPYHSGEPHQGEVEFFAGPPPEIGVVISAESTLRPGRQAMPFPMRLVIGAVVGGLFFGVCSWQANGGTPGDQRFFLLLGGVLGLAALAVTMVATRFKVSCSYVGKEGIASFTLKGAREALAKVQTLVFAQAEELRAKQIKQYVNGIYTGTTYDYVWTGQDGQRLWRANGTYREKKKGIKPGEPFRLVQAAEIAWSVFLLDRVDQALKAEGSIPFRIDKRRVVRVGPGFLEFHFGGEPMRLTTEDIAAVSLASGTFQFKHKDAKWYSQAGKYSFEYGSMANARVFLLALEKLLGYAWK